MTFSWCSTFRWGFSRWLEDWVQQKSQCHIEDSAIGQQSIPRLQVASELSGDLSLEPRVDIKWCPWRMAKIQGMEAKEVRIKWKIRVESTKSSHLKKNSKPARHFPDRRNLKWFVCEELLSMSLLNLIRILVNLIPSQQISMKLICWGLDPQIQEEQKMRNLRFEDVDSTRWKRGIFFPTATTAKIIQNPRAVGSESRWSWRFLAFPPKKTACCRTLKVVWKLKRRRDCGRFS